MKKILILITVIIFGVIFTGCRSKPLEETQYIPSIALSKIDSQSENINNRIWFSSELKNYNKIFINVVLSPNMAEGSLGENFTSRNLFYSKENDFEYLKDYIEDSFIDSFTENINYKLTNTPDSNTLILNFYVVQIVRGKPFLGALSTIGNFTPIGFLMIPVKLGFNAYFEENGGLIAMETLIINNQNKILGVAIDRQKAPTSLINLNNFTTYGNIRDNIDLWTGNIVEILDGIKNKEQIEFKQQDKFKFFIL